MAYASLLIHFPPLLSLFSSLVPFFPCSLLFLPIPPFLAADTDVPTASSSPRNQQAFRSSDGQQQPQQQHRSPSRRISGGLSSQSSPQQSSPLARGHTSARHASPGNGASGSSSGDVGSGRRDGREPLPAKWLESVGLERLQDLRSRLEAVGISPSSERRNQLSDTERDDDVDDGREHGSSNEDSNTSAPIHVAGR